jgi:hypothetical protein
MSDGRVTAGPHFSNPRLNLMSHYDDIAADNFAPLVPQGRSLFLPDREGRIAEKEVVRRQLGARCVLDVAALAGKKINPCD